MYEKIIGGGLMTLGGIAEGIGQRRGLQSMEDEFGRQKQEWAARNAEQQGMIEQELAARRAALNADTIAPGMAAQAAALGGAGTMSKGLGLGGAMQAQTTSRLMPLMPVQARKIGDVQRGRADAVRVGELNTNIGQSRDAQETMGSTYAGRLPIAARTGSLWRRGGVFAQQAGKAIFSMDPKQAQKLPAAAAGKAPKENDPYGDGTL